VAELGNEQLTLDEIYGTSTPSVRPRSFARKCSRSDHRHAVILAGQILIAELKVAMNQTTAHSVSGIRERPPRLTAVSQSAQSIMLCVEHLRKRAKLFGDLPPELKQLARLGKTVEKIDERKLTKGVQRVPIVKRARINGC
jgi:hypothetical protein